MAAKNYLEINIGISSKDRALLAEGLGKVLADTYTLYLNTHNFHWNVVGPQFHTLHVMFMEQYTELWNSIDNIAERIRALGFPAQSSHRIFSKLSNVPDVPEVPPKSKKMIQILATGHETVTRTARKVIDNAEAAKDQPTLDLLTQRLEIHEKTAWMLRSMLED